MTTITISVPKAFAQKIDEKAQEEGFATRSEFIRSLVRNYLSKEPPYGSDKWWECSDTKALEDIRKGRVKRFESVNEAIKWLNS